MIHRLFNGPEAKSLAQARPATVTEPTGGTQRRRVSTSPMAVASLVAILGLLVVACGAPAASPTRPTVEPFSARRESGEGFIVEWSGNTRGHQPGQESTFDLTVTNETGQDWQGRFCLQLLDRQGAEVTVETLEARAFTLQPGLGFSTSIDAQLPEDLTAGAYGLSLVVLRPGGAMVDMVPIQVGDTSDTYGTTTQRDMDAAAEACPLAGGAAIEIP